LENVSSKSKLYPEDKIAITLSVLILLTQFYYYISGFITDLSKFITPAIALAVMMGLIYFQNKYGESKTLKFFRSYIHIPFYGIIFSAFQSFVHKLNPADYDTLLLKADHAVFGFDITRWFDKYTSAALTEVLTLSYFSYYVLPTLSFTLYFFLRESDSFLKVRNYLLAIVIGWYGAFIFYILLPAAGPDIAFPNNYINPLAGLSPVTNLYLENLSKYLRESYVRNTFPSMHFGIILISNYFAYLYRRKYFWFCTLPLGTMLAVATVYLRQHYLIDLAGSVPIAFFSIYFALKLNSKYKNTKRA
jgi:membrane-associated phospholipid phosphatase